MSLKQFETTPDFSTHMLSLSCLIWLFGSLSHFTTALPNTPNQQFWPREDSPKALPNAPNDMRSGDNCFELPKPTQYEFPYAQEAHDAACFLNGNLFEDGTNYFTIRDSECNYPASGIMNIKNSETLDGPPLPPGRPYGTDPSNTGNLNGGQPVTGNVSITGLPAKDSSGTFDVKNGFSLQFAGSINLEDLHLGSSVWITWNTNVDDSGWTELAYGAKQRNFDCSYQPPSGSLKGVQGKCYVVWYTCRNFPDKASAPNLRRIAVSDA
ncbi:MAG: hypothetical protein Q9227_008159 [Pyrenula ochraceoflavens]